MGEAGRAREGGRWGGAEGGEGVGQGGEGGRIWGQNFDTYFSQKLPKLRKTPTYSKF